MEEKNNVLRVAFYIRVSTLEQKTKWYGADYQLDALSDLIKYKGNLSPKWITNKKWLYEDSWYSWGDLNRPAYKQMIEDAKKGEFDMIAVWKIDRMSRNLSHLLKTFEDLKQYGVGFYSVKENIDFSGPIWKLTFQIFWALAEFEREMIKSRTIEWKMASARSGNYTKPSAPYWYQKMKNSNQKWSKLVVVKDEAKIVKKIFEWFMYDDLNYSEISRRLNDMKVPKGIWWMRKNIQSSAWYDTTVKDVLTFSEYAGYVYDQYNKDWEQYSIYVTTPKIISPNLFDLVQEKVKEIEESKKWGIRKYLLSWKIYDPIEFREDWAMRKFVWVARTKGWHSYRRDWIPSKGIKNVEFPWKELDNFVWNHILEFVEKPDDFYKSFKKQTTELNNIERYREEIDILEWRIAEEDNVKYNIDRLELRGKYNENKADKLRAESDDVIIKSQNKIDELEEKINNLLDLELSQSAIESMSDTFKGKLENISEDDKRMIVNLLVDKVLVFYDEKGVNEVEVIFKFNVDNDDNDNQDIEPKSGLDKIKNTLKGAMFFGIGTLKR